MTDEKKLGESLRQSGWNGYIGFSIKAKDTEDNNAVHNAFLEFSKMEAKNDHTLALRLLLGNWQDSGRLDAVWDYMRMLEEKVIHLTQKVDNLYKEETKSEKDDEGMF